MENQVVHAGVVQEISKNKITVAIVSASACSACHAKGACLASDMVEKEIEIFHFSEEYHTGQHVNIIGRTSQGYKAVYYGYVLPFLLVFITLILSIWVTGSEGLAGILSLAILIPYYIALYFLRNKIRSSFEFEIAATNL